MSNKAIFLDADGVINEPVFRTDGKPVAPTCVAEFHIFKDAKESLDKLKAAGYKLICVTNKPDIEEGRMTKEDLDSIFELMRKELPLDDIFACYKRDSECYKPKPGMLFDAAKKYDLDLKQCFIIGDTNHDVGAGKNAECKTIWMDHQYPNENRPEPPPDYTVHSLTEAAEWILNQKND